MPDERLLSGDGDVYEKNVVGDWVRPRPNMTGYERDVGLLGPNIEPDWGGSPKKARDWAGRPVRSRDGRQLYVPKLPIGRPGESLEGIILWAIWAAIVILIALVILGAWIVWRFANSAYYDLKDRQLSVATVGWSVPVILMLVGGVWYAAMPRGSGSVRAESARAGQSIRSAPVTTTRQLPTGPGAGAVAPVRVATVEQTAAQNMRRELRALMPEHRCSPWGKEFDPEVYKAGALAAVNCRGVAPGVEDFALFKFATQQALDAHFAERIRREDLKVAYAAESCANGERGWMAWEHGRVACWTDPPHGLTETELRWTDTRNNIYGVMSATYRDIRRVYRTWLGERP